MAPTPIYSTTKGQCMRVACFVSGSGTNAMKIIERSQMLDARFRVELIFTDVKDETLDKEGHKVCRALDIAKEYMIAYECVDIMDFYASRGQTSKKDLSLRPEFDKLVVSAIERYKIDIIALAGYMSITTKPILDCYDGRIINVHPADLTLTLNRERRYVGMHTVRDAILAGERELRSTTHIVREKVDNGEILVVSQPMQVKLPTGITLDNLRMNKELLKKLVDEHQDRLKKEGDWAVYPLTVQMIAEGRFSLEDGTVYLDGKPVPAGLHL